MSETTRYFVRRSGDVVTHLVRVTESDTQIYGAFFQDGAWFDDPSATDYLIDRTMGIEIDEAEAESIVRDRS